jgi:hypothetical protein
MTTLVSCKVCSVAAQRLTSTTVEVGLGFVGRGIRPKLRLDLFAITPAVRVGARSCDGPWRFQDELTQNDSPKDADAIAVRKPDEIGSI